jgi:hypothetical protein
MVYNHPSDKHAKHEHEKHEEEKPNTVRVKCIVHNRPSTDTRALAFGEEADVPEEIAKIMEEHNFVERVK